MPRIHPSKMRTAPLAHADRASKEGLTRRAGAEAPAGKRRNKAPATFNFTWSGRPAVLLWPRPHPARPPPGLDTLKAQAWRLQPQGPGGAGSVHEPLRNGSRFWKLRKAKGKGRALGKRTPSPQAQLPSKRLPQSLCFLLTRLRVKFWFPIHACNFFLIFVERTFPIMLDSPPFLSPEVATTDLGGGR